MPVEAPSDRVRSLYNNGIAQVAGQASCDWCIVSGLQQADNANICLSILLTWFSTHPPGEDPELQLGGV
jgi:hypothetical protein